MSENTDIVNIYKSKLGQSDIPYSEELWSKLDAELGPVRLAYQKERKRRVFAYFSTAAVMLLAGGTIFYATSGNEKNKKQQVVIEADSKMSCCSRPTIADRYGLENNNPLTQTEKSNTEIAESKTEKNSTEPYLANNSVNQPKYSTAINSAGKKNYVTDRNTAINTSAQKQGKENGVSNLSEVSTVETMKTSESDIENTTEATTIDTKTAKNSTVAPVDADTKQQVEMQPKEAKSTIDITKNALITDAKLLSSQNKGAKPVVKMQALAGVNLSSSFDKPSYYGGAQLQLAANNKLIFAGVKLSKNDLNHQLLNVDKAGTNPTTADAIIQKMTTIQVPFGYQFILNKKQANSTLLSLGFEPTFLTGIQTIYYDNGGVPGGPVTMIQNSPLINKAINKFNVSFIAGLQRRIGRRTHLFGNVGYGLINITDKQFYNKVGSSNNLKYAQFGFGFDLIK